MTEGEFILMIKRQPVGAIILADAWDGSQKKRAKILRDAGYRKDHHEPGTWIRVTTTRYLSGYSAGRLSYKDMKSRVFNAIHSKESEELSFMEICSVTGIHIERSILTVLMTELRWTYDAKKRKWKK